MDQPKLGRLLRLMKLLTANSYLTVENIAEKLGFTPRSVYRYIDTFREAGFVIKKKNGCIRLDKSSPYFKDISELIHFTEEEAYILKSAIESIDENNLLKQNLKKKLYTAHQSGYIDIFRMHSNVKMRVILKMELRSSSLLMEEFPLASKQMQRISDNEWMLDTEVCSYEGVGRFVLGLPGDIVIINSPELVQYIATQVEKIKASP